MKLGASREFTLGEACGSPGVVEVVDKLIDGAHASSMATSRCVSQGVRASSACDNSADVIEYLERTGERDSSEGGGAMPAMTRATEPQDRAAIGRRALKEILERFDMSPSEAARAAGFSSPNRLYNLLNGHSKSLTRDTLEALARVLPGTTPAMLAGEAKFVETPLTPIRTILVRMEARAGLMRLEADLPLKMQFEAAAPMLPGQGPTGAFGVIVRTPGAELLYPADTVLICVPMDRFDKELASHNKVIVERVIDGKVEITVRELIVGEKAYLWPRSTDPEHQAPIPMPWPYPARPWGIGQERIRLVAVVVYACMPQL